MASRPDVLFYVSDSLRADHCSCYGYDRETTPNLDALAAGGVRFSNAFAQSVWTVPSSVSILTGLYPPTHGASTTYDGVPAGAPRIAERLRRAGYATAAVTSVTQVSERRNFHPGFETFEETFHEHPTHEADTARLCTDRFLEWLETVDDDRPFFAFVWSMGTHDPYEPRAGVFTDGSTPLSGHREDLDGAGYDQREVVRDLYDDAVRHADGEFGRLIEHLRARGRYDDTLVAFTADHGEVLAEHGRMEHAPDLLKRLARRVAPGWCARYRLFEPFGHLGHLVVLPYDELIHVPAVLKPPAGRDWAGECDRLVETVDLMPTVADVAGVEFDTQGDSLVAVLEDGTRGKEYVFSEGTQTAGLARFRAVRSAEYKYVREGIDRGSDLDHLQAGKVAFSLARRLAVPREVVFDVAAGERRDLKAEHPEALGQLRDACDRWISTCSEAGERYLAREAEVDGAVREDLRDLGYLE